ncbi:hypothetical protein HYU06_07275 [Candidatus Woesearchaeota archaeon]|nr:hypothetical protein [Candidatus Woesearchaeota archaeon]
MTNSKLRDVEIKKCWTYNGKHCVVTYCGWFCGYAETILKDDDLAENEISVHGGITYAGDLKKIDRKLTNKYYGFDCGHAYDHMEIMNGKCPNCIFGMNCHKWTIKEVKQEVERMVDQIVILENNQ